MWALSKLYAGSAGMLLLIAGAVGVIVVSAFVFAVAGGDGKLKLGTRVHPAFAEGLGVPAYLHDARNYGARTRGDRGAGIVAAYYAVFVIFAIFFVIAVYYTVKLM
jgi:hypothetical protein